MYNEDLDALAAEYVLGTLAGDERIHADTLIATDPGFAGIVHQWERRLGELNVMVKAVEPPPELWGKIKSGMSGRAPSDAVGAGLAVPTAPAEAETVATIEKPDKQSETASEAKAEAASEAKAEAPSEAKAEGPVEAKAKEAKSEIANEDDAAELGAAPLAGLMSPERGPKAEAKLDAKSEAKSEGKAEAKPEAASTSGLNPQPLKPVDRSEIESTELPSLARRLRRWRLGAIACGLVAVALAALIALSAAMPHRIPPRALGLLPAAVRPTPPAPASSRLVAVLQQEPSSPAFLLTIDPTARTLTVRRVSATAQTGHSYELWVLAAQEKPRALGLVDDAEYTQRPLPLGFNIDAMRRARYEISFEPAGGSKSGAPTGPILFTGTLVESAPPPPPPPKS